jgi:hypothetical protein
MRSKLHWKQPVRHIVSEDQAAATNELEALIAEATQAIVDEELIASTTELPGIKEIVAALRAEKDKKTSLEVELTIINKQIDVLTKQALVLLEAAGIHNIRIEGIGLAYQHTSLQPTVFNQDKLVEWAQEHAPEIVKTAVNPQTLKAFLKERAESGEPMPPEDIVRVYYHKSVNLKR